MSFRLLPVLLLLLPFCHAAFSDLFGPLNDEISMLPYELRGTWHNIGVKALGRKSGAVELYKSSIDNHELFRFDVRVYDAGLFDLESANNNIGRFWRIYLGYPQNRLSSVTFSGYAAVDHRTGRLVAVHRDTPLREAYQVIKPREMTFDRFSNLSINARNHRSYYYGYHARYGNEHQSSCLFKLHLKLKESPKCNVYQNRFHGEGTFEAATCQTKLNLKLGDFNYSYPKFNRSATLLGVLACVLNVVQLAALLAQGLYGWRTKTLSNVSVPTVIALLLLTMHTTTAFSIFADVVYPVRGAFVAAAIPSGICAGAYAGWLVLVWVMRGSKSIKISIIESCILLAITAATFCLSYLAMRFIPGVLMLFSLALYAFFVPQIVCNHKSGSNARAIHPIFAAVAVIVNMFTPVYSFLLAPSFLYMEAKPIIALSLATFLIAQAICLIVQYNRKSVPVPSGYSAIDATEPSETFSLVGTQQTKLS